MSSIKITFFIGLFLLQVTTAFALNFPLKRGVDVVGELQTVTTHSQEDLAELTQQYQVGYFEFKEANPQVDLQRLWPGTTLIVPTQYVLPETPHSGIVINVAELRMYYYPSNKNIVYTFPVGIGRIGSATPILFTRIVEKEKNPFWVPTTQTLQVAAAGGTPLPKIVPPGPENPLGDYAMRLGLPSYLIHGTNDPAGVGLRSSAGCIRMLPENIETLFHSVKINTPVRIINQPIKVGWDGKDLYLEIHSPLTPEEGQSVLTIKQLDARLMKAAKKRKAEIDWSKVMRCFNQRTGIPVVVGVARV